MGSAHNNLYGHTDNRSESRTTYTHLKREYHDYIQNDINNSTGKNPCHGTIRIAVCPDEDGYEVGEYSHRQEYIDVVHVGHGIWEQGFICTH